MVVQHLKQIRKVKKLDKWVRHKLMQINNIILTRRLLLFYTTVSHFSIGLWRATKSGFYITTRNDQLSGWTEKKLQSISQSQICTKKTSWSLSGGLLPVWSTTAFWVLAKTWHLRSVLSKSTSFTANLNTCSSSPGQRPIARCTTNASEVGCIGLRSSASVAMLIWPLANWLPLLQATWQLFAGKNLPQPAGGRKCVPRGHWILRHGFLGYRNKQTYFSLAKMCWLQQFLFWSIKMCVSLVMMI